VPHLLNLLNREETVAKVEVVHELRKLAAALPDCRGKLGQVVAWGAENEGKCRSRSPDLSLEAGDRGALAGCIEAALSQVLLRHRSACLTSTQNSRLPVTLSRNLVDSQGVVPHER